MARFRDKLKHAPIVEALLDVGISIHGEPPTLERFSNLGDLLKERYPHQEPIRSVEARFGPDEGFSQKTSDLGFLFRSADRKQVAQFRLNGFTFNQLEPYSDWPTLFGEALRLCGIYAGVVPDAVVSRVGVRFINRMKFPRGADLGEYLTAPPVLPPEIPQVVRQFLSRIVVEDLETNCAAVITQALEPTIDPAHASILLDVDTFRELGNPVAFGDKVLQEVFGHLRALKNRIFYASIKEKTVEMYQ